MAATDNSPNFVSPIKLRDYSSFIVRHLDREVDDGFLEYLSGKPVLRSCGPALVDVRVRRNELSIPLTIKFEQMTGFGLYIARAVINGRMDEVIDLTRTNLFR